MINKSLEGKSKKVTLYVLNDGSRMQLLDEKDIRKRARDLAESDWLPEIESAIEFLWRFYDEEVKPVEVMREDLIYFAHEVL